jgi:hypothetical protein
MQQRQAQLPDGEALEASGQQQASLSELLGGDLWGVLAGAGGLFAEEGDVSFEMVPGLLQVGRPPSGAACLAGALWGGQERPGIRAAASGLCVAGVLQGCAAAEGLGPRPLQRQAAPAARVSC